MPRFSFAFHESHDKRLRAPKADAYGRRPRQVSGVRVVGEREDESRRAALSFTVAATMAVVAAVSVSLALWRLYTFHH
jgi:hypothetical protein